MTTPDPKSCLVVASVSGGKDSTAMSLWLTEHEIPHRRVWANTGWEHPDTDAYVREYLPGVLGPIDHVQSPKGGLVDLATKRGMFPSRLRRFCTQELKVFPIQRYVEEAQEYQDREVVNAVGIRAGESLARSKMTAWEWSDSFDCWVWRPMLAMTESDVIEIHRRHGVRPNPLYLKGAKRVGCWPCIFAGKTEIRLVSELTPERIDEIRDLEAKVGAAAVARCAAKGETMESKGYSPPTFFHTKNHAKPGDPPVSMLPIDEAVAWSKTSHGGKQLSVFQDDPQDGCMRWGLCETSED